MVNTLPLPQPLKTDAWVKATWRELTQLKQRPELETAQFYYDAGYMRIETMPIGAAHGRDNSLLSAVISLYGTLKDIDYVASFVGSNFSKTGERECQPDLAYYIGSDVPCPPKNNQAIDIDLFGPPTLVIEISATTLDDDLGSKRLLYERLGVQEYWVVDVEKAVVIAFSIADGGSRRIQMSTVVTGLPMEIVEEVLQRSKTEKERDINRWLLAQFG